YPRLLPVLVSYMFAHRVHRREKDARIIGKADAGKEIGNNVGWQDEIGKRAEQHRLDERRAFAVHRAVKAGGHIFGEGNAPDIAAELVRKLAHHEALVAFQLIRIEGGEIIIGRLRHGVNMVRRFDYYKKLNLHIFTATV